MFPYQEILPIVLNLFIFPSPVHAINSDLLADSSSSIFTGSRVPKWLSQATNRGRNVIVLRDSTRNNHREEDENGEGVAALPGTELNVDCLSNLFFNNSSIFFLCGDICS